jgi:hypothetical protein
MMTSLHDIIIPKLLLPECGFKVPMGIKSNPEIRYDLVNRKLDTQYFLFGGRHIAHAFYKSEITKFQRNSFSGYCFFSTTAIG